MSSGDWYRKAGQERDKARKLEKHKKALEPVVRDIQNSFGGVISSINSKIIKTVDELEIGMRKDSSVNTNTSLVSEGNEFEALSDTKMTNCCSDLKQEIRDLETKIQEAERLAQQYQDQGDRELEEERRERERRIRESMSK